MPASNKQKRALVEAKKMMSPAIESFAPDYTEIPDGLDIREMAGWIAGETYVRYLADDGLSREKAASIVTQLASNPNLDLSVLADESQEEDSTEGGPTEEDLSDA